MRTPDFIIGGAPRSGTTWLCHLLARHPDIGLARPIAPEPKFFLVDELYRRGLPYYAERWFDGLTQGVVGEKSTNYLESPSAAERIARDLPRARLIFLLRDPVERAFSNYRWSCAHGHETLDFPAALAAEASRPVPSDLRYARPFAYAARGMYARLLRPYFARLPRDRILLLRFEDVGRDLAAAVHRFLGVAPRPDDASGLPPVNGCDHAEAMPPPSRARLAALFAVPDRDLAELAGIDVSGWTSQRFAA